MSSNNFQRLPTISNHFQNVSKQGKKKEPSGPLVDGHDGLDDLNHQVEFLDGEEFITAMVVV